MTDAAWAAGLFEGEGCIDSPNGRPRLQLNTTDEDVARRFQAIVGGKVWGPYTTGTHKPYWHWGVNRLDQVLDIAEMFFPYLGDRRLGKFVEVLGLDS